MRRLMRATALIGQPVVTLTGESPLEVKDVVFDTDSGQFVGFTLRNHGFLGAPVEEQLAWSDVHGLGPDAVIVSSTDVLRVPSHPFDASAGSIIGNRILTDDGTDLGRVVEAVVTTGAPAAIAGFEVEVPPELRDDSDHVFVPMPDTVSISGRKIVVPAATADHICSDLSGFGAAVEQLREELSDGSSPTGGATDRGSN